MCLVKDASGNRKDFLDMQIEQFAAFIAEQFEQSSICLDYFAIVRKNQKTARRIV